MSYFEIFKMTSFYTLPFFWRGTLFDDFFVTCRDLMKTSMKYFRIFLIAACVISAFGLLSCKRNFSGAGRMERDRALYNNGDPELIMAEVAAAMEPVSVVQKPKSFSGNLHNYESLSSYAWPDPSNPSAPWTDRDGELNPEVNRYDRTRINDMSSRLSLFFNAWQKSGESRFKDAYFKQIDTWFLDKATRMNPHMEYSQIRVGADDNHGQPHGIIDAYVLTDVLRTLRAFDRRGELNKPRKKALVTWFSAFNDWLMTSNLAERERAQANNHSIACDVLIYDIALFTGNDVYADAIQDSFASSRLAVQIRPDGTMPGELKRTRAYHYSIFNLKHILDFCFLARDVRGVDFYLSNRGPIDASAAYLSNFIGHKELFPYMQIDGLSTWEDEEKLLTGELSRLNLLRDGVFGTALKRELYMVDHDDTYSESFREERKQDIRSRYDAMLNKNIF